MSAPAETGTEESGDDLLERLRRSEPAAVGTVYDRHHAAIRAFSRRLVGDDTAAEDLVHEVFVTLPSAIRRFRGQSSLRTFLISVAVNHARHHVRSAARRRAAMQRFASEEAPDATDRHADPRRYELAQALSKALDTVPLKQRVAFVLCDVEGHTSAEAALIAGVPEATVRTRLFHARKRLRDCLEKEGFR